MFACGYVLVRVRVAHVLLFACGTRDVTVRGAALALAPTVGVASGLIAYEAVRFRESRRKIRARLA